MNRKWDYCGCLMVSLRSFIGNTKQNKTKKENPKENEKNMKDDLTGHIMCRNCFLTHVVQGRLERKIEWKRRRGRRRKQLLDDFKERILEIYRESTRSYCVENSLWKGLWSRRKTDYELMTLEKLQFRKRDRSHRK
jgi:hypothetical protein